MANTKDPKLLIDQNSAAIQAIELSDDCIPIAVGLTSSADAVPTGAKLVRIGIDTDCYIRWGSSAAVTVSTTNGHFFPRGVEVLVVPKGVTHIANISADGVQTGTGTIASCQGTHLNSNNL